MAVSEASRLHASEAQALTSLGEVLWYAEFYYADMKVRY